MRRKKNNFRQAVVYRWLLANGPVTGRQLADHLEISIHAANHLLWRMSRAGHVTRDDAVRGILWTAVKGRRPEDMRGTSTGSQSCLRLNLDKWHIGLNVARAKKGLLPLSGPQGKADMRKFRREGASEEMPAIPTLADLLMS